MTDPEVGSWRVDRALDLDQRPGGFVSLSGTPTNITGAGAPTQDGVLGFDTSASNAGNQLT
jgi:hypothetical protein